MQMRRSDVKMVAVLAYRRPLATTARSSLAMSVVEGNAFSCELDSEDLREPRHLPQPPRALQRAEQRQEVPDKRCCIKLLSFSIATRVPNLPVGHLRLFPSQSQRRG
eukprot:1547158-Amphidinium_carterae.1